MKFPIPADEEKRLSDLLSYRILDTAPEKEFDEITKLAASICGTKMSLISFIDKDRQWFKSKVGVEVTESPREISMCTHAIMENELFLVEDATKDYRFSDMNYVKGDPGVRFYAGAPLVTPSGSRIGTLCVVDTEFKKLEESQKQLLKTLAKNVVDLLELRTHTANLTKLMSQYRDVQSMSLTGGWELNIQTGEVYWSDTVYDIYAIPAGTPINKIDAVSYYAPHERERLLRVLDNAIRKYEPYDERFEFIDAKGQHKWIRTIGKPVLGPNNELLKLVGTFKDISKYVEAENSILKRTTELESYIRGLNQFAIVVKTDTDGKIMMVNSNFCEISGYSEEELIGKDHRIINSGYHPKSFFEDLWSTILSGKVWRGEIKNRAKAGHDYWVDTAIAPIHDMDGKIKEFVAFRSDVTKRKAAELMNIEISQLRAAFIKLKTSKKNFFEHVLQQLLKITNSSFGYIGVIVKDQSGPHLRSIAISDISWNEESKLLFQRQEPFGLIFHNLNSLYGEVIKTSKPFFTNSAQGHPKAGGTPKGHPQIDRFLGLPMHYNGELIAMAGVANRPEGYSEILVQELSPLIDVVGEMLNVVAYEEELELQRQLSTHNSKLASIGSLAAGVGHEINNPLTVISGQVSLTKDYLSTIGFEDEIVHERLKKMEVAVERIENIVKGLRTFARPNDNSLSEVNLVELAQETLNMMKDIYKEEQVRLSFTTSFKELMVLGNRGKIQQVLVNLISNAKDALRNREHGQIEVKVDQRQGEVLLEISDNGVGIPKDIQGRIFDPFFTTKDVNQGTGIGLSLVNTIIKEHGGRVEVESNINEGSVFTVHFPINFRLRGPVSAEFDNRLQATDVIFRSNEPVAKILIVDDDEELREIFHSYASKFCSLVYVAGSADEALKLIKAEGIDLVFSDIKMPGTDGFKLLENLRKLEDIVQPKFVFISAGVMLDEQQQMIIMNLSDGYLSKPFSREKILNKIKELLPNRRLQI